MPNDIDADIAVKVMGLPNVRKNSFGLVYDCGKRAIGGPSFSSVPRYSTDPAASRKVIKELNRRGFDVQVYHMADGRVNAKVIDDIETVRGVAVAVDADLAICKAALAALAEEGAGDE